MPLYHALHDAAKEPGGRSSESVEDAKAASNDKKRSREPADLYMDAVEVKKSRSVEKE